jgi:hypothetical protein
MTQMGTISNSVGIVRPSSGPGDRMAHWTIGLDRCIWRICSRRRLIPDALSLEAKAQADNPHAMRNERLDP